MMGMKKRKMIGSPGIAELLIIMCLSSAILMVSCLGKASGGSREAAAGGKTEIFAIKSAEAEIPHVEKALELPAIERGKEGILIAYRHTGFGFVDANGFDTLIYRFQALPGGWLEGAIVSERRLGGDKEIRRYGFSYAGDEVIVTESSEGSTKEIARMKTSKDVQEIHGTAERIVSRGSEGSLIVRSLSGDYSEEYMMPAGGKEKKSLISRSGAVEVEGSYAFPGKGMAVYRERRAGDSKGAEDLQLSLWIDDKGDDRFRTESVVPLNEVYASGLKESLGGDQGLQNLALVDLLLGKTRNIRPVLAYLLSKP